MCFLLLCVCVCVCLFVLFFFVVFVVFVPRFFYFSKYIRRCVLCFFLLFVLPITEARLWTHFQNPETCKDLDTLFKVFVSSHKLWHIWETHVGRSAHIWTASEFFQLIGHLWKHVIISILFTLALTCKIFTTALSWTYVTTSADLLKSWRDVSSTLH